MAVVLSGANVVGYTKCSKQASAQLRSYATQAVTSGLTVRDVSPLNASWERSWGCDILGVIAAVE